MKEYSELTIELACNEDHEETILFLKERKEPSPREFHKIGLTKRESEILHWIRLGKTDEVIGLLCGCAVRTVQKHVEHIRQKMNAETRTAAVQRALDLLGDIGSTT